jgi:hypothetical protein
VDGSFSPPALSVNIGFSLGESFDSISVYLHLSISQPHLRLDSLNLQSTNMSAPAQAKSKHVSKGPLVRHLAHLFPFGS